MTADELTTAIQAADDDDLIWAVFARHAGGDVELHSVGAADAYYAAVVRDFAADLSAMEDVAHVLTGAAPIACGAAAEAGLELLGDCARCATL